MTSLKSVLSHSQHIVTRKTGSDCVLVPVTNNIADMDSVYTLNETGSFIWEKIDGKRTIEELIKAMISEYDIDEETAMKDIFSFVENLRKYLIIN